MRDQVLVSATVVVDTETDSYSVGDLDFSIPATTLDWLDAAAGRSIRLADWLGWLAYQCKNRTGPFRPLGASGGEETGENTGAET